MLPGYTLGCIPSESKKRFVTPWLQVVTSGNKIFIIYFLYYLCFISYLFYICIIVHLSYYMNLKVLALLNACRSERLHKFSKAFFI